MILLDTNTCIYIINNRPLKVLDRFNTYKAGEIGISSIAASELAYGAAKSGTMKNRKALDMFLASLQILPFDSQCLWFYADLRIALEKNGLIKPPRPQTSPAPKQACQLPRPNLQRPAWSPWQALLQRRTSKPPSPGKDAGQA